MKYFYCLLFSLLGTTAFAQSNFQPGYVVNAQGDTLKGYIDYREWDSNPRSIAFKDNSGSNIFTPSEIRAFEINGLEKYVSYTGKISTDKTRFPNLDDHLDTSFAKQTVFLKMITQGKYLTLYTYSDFTKSRCFLAEQNAEPFELIFRQYYGEDSKVITSDIYKGQLIVYANKYSAPVKVIRRIEVTNYNVDGIREIVNQINQIEINTRQVYAGKFYVGIGVNARMARFDGTENPFSKAGTVTAYSPRVTAGYDIFSTGKITQRVVFGLEGSLCYASSTFKAPYNIAGVDYDGTYIYNQLIFTGVVRVRFNLYSINKFKLYIASGGAFNYEFSSKNEFQFTSNNRTFTTDNPYRVKNFYVNVPIEVGVTLNKNEISATYLPKTNVSDVDYSRLDITSFNLGFKHRF